MNNIEKFYIAMTFCVDGKYFAQSITATELSNVASFFQEQKNLVSANVFKTKKKAAEATKSWNEEFIKNKSYYYQDCV
jgi:hypothetical protein